MSNKELFLSTNNLKENFQTVADEILKNTGYNISRHRSLETKFNSMAQIILNKTNQEEQTLLILNTKLQESSVLFFQKVIKKNKNSKQNIEFSGDINSNKSLNANSNLDNQMTQLIDSRNQLVDTPGATENYMPRPVNPSSEYNTINQGSSELDKLYQTQSQSIKVPTNNGNNINSNNINSNNINSNNNNNTTDGYNIRQFNMDTDTFNTLSFDNEKDLPLYQNISTLQQQDNSNPMELMTQVEQARQQNVDNYNLLNEQQRNLAKSITTQGDRDIVLERNNTDATTKIDQTLVEPKLLHQHNLEWQDRMLKDIDTRTVSNNIVSNLDKKLDDLLQSKLINLQKDSQPEYQDRINYISVNSVDRKWENDMEDESRYSFQVKFNASSDFSGAGINTNFKNVVSVELVSAILPVDAHIESFDTRIYLNIMKYPYLLLNIEELDGVFRGTNINNDKAFSTLVFDKFHNSEILSADMISGNVSVSAGKTSFVNEFKRGYIRYNPAYFEKKRYYNAPLASLNKLSINLTDPRGNRFNTLGDTNTIDSIVFSDALSAIGSTLELTATNGFPNTDSTSHKMIKITSTKHFSNRMFRIGDRIMIKNYTTTGSGANNSKFINFINREEGHIIINLEQERFDLVGDNKGQISELYIAPPGDLDSNKENLDATTYFDSSVDTGGYSGDSASFINMDLQTHFLFRIVTRAVNVSNITKPINV
jgi:hypothetical protein